MIATYLVGRDRNAKRYAEPRKMLPIPDKIIGQVVEPILRMSRRSLSGRSAIDFSDAQAIALALGDPQLVEAQPELRWSIERSE
jgi:hypothetical protein